MKKILTMAIVFAIGSGLCAMADTQATKLYTNKYIDITVKQPVYNPATPNLQDYEAVQKIQKTKETVDATKKNITDLKTLWGVK